MKSNPSDEPTQEHAAKNGTVPPSAPFRTKHEDPVLAWIQGTATWTPDEAFAFLDGTPIRDQGFWAQDTTMVLCAKLRQDKRLWLAVKHLARTRSGTYGPELEAFVHACAPVRRMQSG